MMCLRFGLFWQNIDFDQLLAELRNNPYLPDFEQFEGTRPIPRYNIAPSQLTPIIRTTSRHTKKMEMGEWGFIPSFAKTKPKVRPGNARAETIKTHPLFRHSYKSQRCLIPATGFYEPKGPKTLKHRPWYWFRMADGLPFMFGGLWGRWHPPGAEPIDTFTLVTTTPNELVGTVHDRMPLILRPADYVKWVGDDDDPSDLLKPFSAEGMESWPVGDGAKKTVNRETGELIDNPSLIEPLSLPSQPAIPQSSSCIGDSDVPISSAKSSRRSKPAATTRQFGLFPDHDPD
jgi:putative SOS response-associated peptidase YedK